MVEVYPKNFAGIGSSYLQSKGLSLQEWAAGVLMDIKADFFALYGLCLLTERHAVVHLKDGKIWTSLKNPPNDHDKILEMCQLHLVYLGRNLFVELTKRLNPIQIIDSNEDVKVISLGGLTFGESKTLDKVIYRGLGVGVHRIPGVPVHTKYRLRVTNPPSEVIIKQEHNEESETDAISAEERTGDPEPHSSKDQDLEEESYKTNEKDSLTETVKQQESETEKEAPIVKKPHSSKDQDLEEESYKTNENDSLTETVKQQESETEKEASILKKPESMKLKVAKISIMSCSEEFQGISFFL